MPVIVPTGGGILAKFEITCFAIALHLPPSPARWSPVQALQGHWPAALLGSAACTLQTLVAYKLPAGCQKAQEAVKKKHSQLLVLLRWIPKLSFQIHPMIIS